MRTYAGHSSAAKSNALYRKNLAKGQTGLSVAFDLPTQTGYDPDHILSRGEVGKVGVPIPHLGTMRRLFQDIPLGEMNTSMTINATAMWMLSMYQVAAEEQGVEAKALAGTTQNDIIKEYLSRGTYVFPPEASLRLTTDMIAYTVANIPKWNPLNICSWMLLKIQGRSQKTSSSRSSVVFRSSSTLVCVSLKKCARCARSAKCGKKSLVIVTVSKIRRCGVSVTACKSTRSA